MMGPYKNLDVWQKSMTLISEIYRITESFPKSEIFGLTSQMRRASVSIPSNIAEGYGRISNAEVLHFLHIALGSSNELDCQIEIARNLKFIENDIYESLVKLNNDVNKMLHSLIFHREQI